MPEAYYDLKWDDPQRKVYREMIAYETIQANDKVLEGLELEELVPKIYQRIDGEVIEHDMRSQACNNFAKPMDGFSRGLPTFFRLICFRLHLITSRTTFSATIHSYTHQQMC